MWADRSQAALERQLTRGPLCINPVIYSEVSARFGRVEDLHEAPRGRRLGLVPVPREGLFLAGKAFLRSRRAGGRRRAPLPDFFLGAHAAVAGLALLTRDRRLAAHVPTVDVISPA